MMTTNAHDSGVETSNDSNDTVANSNNAAPGAAATAATGTPIAHHHAFSFPTGSPASSASTSSGLSFPQGFEQRSQTQFTTRNALMLYGEGGTAAASRLFFVRPMSSSSAGNSNSSSSSGGGGTSQTTTTQSSLQATRSSTSSSSCDSSNGGNNNNDMDTCTTSTSTTTSSNSTVPPGAGVTFRPFDGQQQVAASSISDVSAQLAERSSKTLIDTCNVVSTMLRSQMSASIASVVQQQPSSSASLSPSAMLMATGSTLSAPASTSSCPPSPHSNPHGRFELRVPLAFLSSFQPTYPNDSHGEGAGGSSTSSGSSHHAAAHDLHQLNRLKAVRSAGGAGAGSLLHHHHPHRHHQVPYIICVSNERKLRLAASLSNVEVLLRLLDAGVNPNSVDEYKRSALHLAASRGYTDVVIQLLKYGARTGAQDSLGNTPLHLAVCSASSFNFNRVVRILLRHGASVQVQDNHGKTPLDLVKSKLSMMRLRRANDHSPEAIKMLFDLSVLTALLISTCMRELKSADDINSLEQRLQQLSTSEVECEADALLAKVEQLTLKN